MTIETKFNRDDTVWLMYENAPLSVSISELAAGCNSMGLSITYRIYIASKVGLDRISLWKPESDIFKSKSDLLNSL